MIAVQLVNSDEVALIDPEDLEVVSRYRWYLSKRKTVSYAMAHPNGKTIYMHRLLCPGHPAVDHVNDDGLDNRRHNLRGCVRAQNEANKKRPPSLSGYKGIFKHPKSERWYARIGHEGVKIGLFASPEEAARAYDVAATERYGEFAVLNFPR